MNKKEKAQLILRDTLALDRTKLANQRTLLSYIRTGIYFIMTAIGLSYLGKNTGFGWAEWALTGVGIVAVVIGFVSYFVIRKKINSAYDGSKQKS